MSDKIVREVSRAQNALLDWGEANPYAKIKELEFVDGDPMKLIYFTKDGIGTALIRFDKIVNAPKGLF